MYCAVCTVCTERALFPPPGAVVLDKRAELHFSDHVDLSLIETPAWLTAEKDAVREKSLAKDSGAGVPSIDSGASVPSIDSGASVPSKGCPLYAHDQKNVNVYNHADVHVAWT
jgi:hypothetical protein